MLGILATSILQAGDSSSRYGFPATGNYNVTTTAACKCRIDSRDVGRPKVDRYIGRESTGMDQFEYKSLIFPNSHPSDDPINTLARDGWRVISSVRLDDDRIWLLFERPIVLPRGG